MKGFRLRNSLFIILMISGILFTVQSYAQTTTAWSDNCNSSTGWSLSGTIPNSSAYPQISNSWQVVTPTYPSPYENQCFYTEGNSTYLEASDGNFAVYVLTSPVINLSGYNNCILSFMMFLETENTNWDGAYVEYSTDGGSSWSTLTPYCPAYSGNISQNETNPYNPGSTTPTHPAYFGSSWSSGGWRRANFDISSYDNIATFRLRFVLFSDELTADNGWAIDDLKIINNPPDISVEGNGGTPAIDDNSNYSSVSYLDFGSTNQTKQFQISNSGVNSTLNLTNSPYVQISGASEFSITAQPSGSSISGAGTEAFGIEFDPTGGTLGFKYATVTILNDDYYSECPDKSTYTFNIRGEVANTPPVADNDSYSCFYTESGLGFSVSAAGVLIGDTDAEGDGLTAHLVTDIPAGSGSLTLNANGSFTYTPPNGFTGLVQFTYRAYDGTAYSNTATVTINVEIPEFVVNNGNFNIGSNWNCGYVPPESLDIIIDTDVKMLVNQSYTCKNLTFESATSSFTCTPPNKLTITGDVYDGNGNIKIDVSSSLVVSSSIQIEQSIAPTSPPDQ